MTIENSLTIELETLTPIWTGGVEGKVDRLHATGIMGSLRWWYEALVRGVGGKACDPSQHTCEYDPKKPDEGLCHACRVFGATGWSRRFRLVVNDRTVPTRSPLWPNNSRLEGRPYIRNGRRKIPVWPFKDRPHDGQFSLQIILTGPLYERKAHDVAHDEFFEPEIISGLIEFMEEWGSLGAKPQMGFGLFKITSQKPPVSSTGPGSYRLRLLEHLRSLPEIRTSTPRVILPSLKTMFFTSIRAGSTRPKETFYLKSDLRRAFSPNGKVEDLKDQRLRDEELRHFVLGTIKGEHQGAKIMMSHPTQDNTIRIWGWIPETITLDGNRFTRDEVIEKIHTFLEGKRMYWRELNSLRDTKCTSYKDSYEFLASLMRGEK